MVHGTKDSSLPVFGWLHFGPSSKSTRTPSSVHSRCRGLMASSMILLLLARWCHGFLTSGKCKYEPHIHQRLSLWLKWTPNAVFADLGFGFSHENAMPFRGECPIVMRFANLRRFGDQAAKTKTNLWVARHFGAGERFGHVMFEDPSKRHVSTRTLRGREVGVPNSIYLVLLAGRNTFCESAESPQVLTEPGANAHRILPVPRRLPQCRGTGEPSRWSYATLRAPPRPDLGAFALRKRPFASAPGKNKTYFQ